jgi:phenylalanyl-tRNA synthetase beta chain
MRNSQIIQVSDVILLSKAHDVGARNERRIIAVYSNKESGFEVVHGLLNRIMEIFGVPYRGELCHGEVL